MACYPTLTVNHVIFPPSFDEAKILSAFNYQPERDDIFIVTYPKSGTTWMAYMLTLIRSSCSVDGILKDNIGFLEKDGADAMRNLPQPRIMKTHLPYKHVPWSNEAKYIFIARNPLDACVSGYHHIRGFDKYNFYDGTFEDYFDTFVKGVGIFGDYFQHLISLYSHRNKENVFFLTYESIKENPGDAICSVAKFLGGQFAEKTKDCSFVDKVVEMSSFSSMQAKNDTFCGGRFPDRPFIRKGIIGDYRNIMSDEQVRFVNDHFRNICAESDVLKLWERYNIPE